MPSVVDMRKQLNLYAEMAAELTQRNKEITMPTYPKPWDALRTPKEAPPIGAGTFKISPTSMLNVHVLGVGDSTMHLSFSRPDAVSTFAIGKKTARALSWASWMVVTGST